MYIMPSKSIKSPSVWMSDIKNNDTWTDGLPICCLSGVGMSANQLYREDGTPSSEHEYEDRSFHFCLDRDNSTYLYGVFDGHEGSKAAYFASQRMPAELSFEQLLGKSKEHDVQMVFREAFLAVENGFLESIDPKIAERTELLDKIPDGMSQFEAAQRLPEIVSRLQSLDQEIRGGCTAVVALLHNGTLHVGNVGNSRALLCKKDKSGVLKVKQLTDEHTTSSHDELVRLSNLNLDSSKLRGAKFGNHDLTRCIGSYFMKGGYKEFDMLSAASSEPLIAEPYITSVPIDESCSFLLLMSDGLYKTYQEATKSEQVNKEIAQMVVEQFVEQPTITSVAQTVVDKVVRLHHDIYLTRQSHISTRDDITLIIRNFNFHMKSAWVPSMQPGSYPGEAQGGGQTIGKKKERLSSSSSVEDQTYCDDTPTLPLAPTTRPRRPPRRRPGLVQRAEPIGRVVDVDHSESTVSTDSSEMQNPSFVQFSLDEDGCIEPYVNFESYYSAIDEAHTAGLISDSQLHMYK